VRRERLNGPAISCALLGAFMLGALACGSNTTRHRLASGRDIELIRSSVHDGALVFRYRTLLAMSDGEKLQCEAEALISDVVVEAQRIGIHEISLRPTSFKKSFAGFNGVVPVVITESSTSFDVVEKNGRWEKDRWSNVACP
jgi:hypothetical protein